MLKRSITYENPFTEQPVTVEAYFHISKTTYLELQMENLKEPEITDPASGETLDGYRAKLQRIMNDQDGPALLETLKDLIRRAYGKKNGDDWIQSRALSDEFENSGAFSQLLFEIGTDEEKAQEFLIGAFPGKVTMEEITAEVERRQAALGEADPSGLTTPTPDTPREPGTESWGAPRGQEIANATSENPVVLTQAEVADMDDNEFKSGIADGRYKLS